MGLLHRRGTYISPSEIHDTIVRFQSSLEVEEELTGEAQGEAVCKRGVR